MAFCTNCGFELQQAFRFCPSCGAPCASMQTPYSDAEHGAVEYALEVSNSTNQTPAVETIIPQWVHQAIADSQSYKDMREYFASEEWTAKPILNNGFALRGAPNVTVRTPFANVVWKCIQARRDYEDVDPTQLYAEFKTHVSMNVWFVDHDTRQDIDSWRIVLDPDGLRAKPEYLQPEVSWQNSYWYHSLGGYFNGIDLYSAPRRDLTIAVVRGWEGEVRYVLPASAR